MAHKKGGGSTRNGRDSIGKRLGVKNFLETMSPQGAFSPDSVERIYTPVTTSALVTTIHFTQKLMGTYGLSEKINIAGR